MYRHASINRRKSNGALAAPDAAAGARRRTSLATRAALIAVAEQVFLDKGASATTLEMIAAKAGMTRGAIYWHFENKDQLLREIIDGAASPLSDMFRSLLSVSGTPSVARLRNAGIETLTAILHTPVYRRRLTIALLKCEYTEDVPSLIEQHTRFRREMVGEIAAYLARIPTKGGRHDWPAGPREIAEALLCYYTGLLVQYLRAPSSLDLKRRAATYLDIFFAGLEARPVRAAARRTSKHAAKHALKKESRS